MSLNSENASYVKIVPNDESTAFVAGYAIANPSANFTRPANTIQYSVGDIVANSTVNTSVTPLTLSAARLAAGSFELKRCRLYKSNNSLTNASFRVHFMTSIPTTITNGDNGVFLISGVANYIGSMDVTMDMAFTDGAWGTSTPNMGSKFNVKLGSGINLYALIEAKAAYTPASGEVFTLVLDDLQN